LELAVQEKLSAIEYTADNFLPLPVTKVKVIWDQEYLTTSTWHRILHQVLADSDKT